MKSIVLCERTLVHESEDFTLKDGKINEEHEITEEKIIINGISENKRSETVIVNPREPGKSNRHESNESSETFRKEISEVDGRKSKSTKELENGVRRNSTLSVTDISVAIEKDYVCGDREGKDFVLSEADLLIKDNPEDGAQSSSGRVKNLNLNRKTDFTILRVEISDEILESDKNDLKASEEGKEENSLESETSVVDIDLDVDENKENEKEVKRNQIEEFSENASSKKESNECKIQVGDVQSITGSEKDCIWAENDFKSSSQDQREITVKKFTKRSQDVFCLNENSTDADKGNIEFEVDENAVFEAEENADDTLRIEEKEEDEVEEEEGQDEDEEEDFKEAGQDKEEMGEEEESKIVENKEKCQQVKEIINEEDKNNITNIDKLFISKTETNVDMKNKTCQQKKGNVVYRKRRLSDSGVLSSSAKKKRYSRISGEAIRVQAENEDMEDSSRCEDLASLDTVGVSSEGLTSSESGKIVTKRTSTDGDKGEKKLKLVVENENPKVEAKFSVLEKFRGTLKTLTRSDLEELIVQKLCEVITERSNVGELRRKAQALEQDQERWKTKVQTLTKQMKEMEMVMKKYMTEVQKQVKEGDTHIVTPLKVTRSVGLQVSFYSSANKGFKPGLSQPSTPPSPTQNLTVRNAKGSPPKLPLQLSPANQNMRNSSFQKGSPTLQKSPVNLQRRSIVPKPDYLSSQSNRAVQQSLLSSTRGIPNQAPRPTLKSVSGITTTTTTISASTAPQQQQQQNGSKIIDLTEDDDRQTGNVLKTSGPIRVVNHLPQPQGSQGNRFAYLLPTTSAATATSGGQSRQVLIATPTMPQPSRQIMCSMPPLLFKGGNIVQSGSQPHMVSHSNKVILPKPHRHPAPLPQQPINQNTRPSLKLLPPRPALKISKVQTGIVLSWNMSLSPDHAPISSYQLYAYQESNCPPSTSLWKKVGDVKALPLPMACTLTQFMSGHKYHFAVRAVDLHSRIGPFSFPGTIVLIK